MDGQEDEAIEGKQNDLTTTTTSSAYVDKQ